MTKGFAVYGNVNFGTHFAPCYTVAVFFTYWDAVDFVNNSTSNLFIR